jgi:hypothetical protein
MTRAKDDLHLMVPQRFFTHASICKVTVTSTPHGRVSFRTPVREDNLANCGSWCRGRGPLVKVRASTWAHACAGYGGRSL